MFLSCLYLEISVLNTNSVDPDKMTHSAVFDLDLHYLPMSLLWDARHKWVNLTYNKTYLYFIKGPKTKYSTAIFYLVISVIYIALKW